jgi:DNA repair photolyase
MITHKEVKSVLNKHKKRDSWFHDDYSINPYEGCGFNCIYCYIRGSKYGENLSEKIQVKQNAPEILDKQLALRARKNEYGFIAVGSATDAYMQVEKDLGQTRKLLEVIKKHRFPVFISTKSTLVLRDFDILSEIDRTAIKPPGFPAGFNHKVILSFSLSILDADIARQVEPGAPSPWERLEALKISKEKGFLAGVNAIPLLPFINDTEEELEKLIRAAKSAGADYVLAGGLTLFGSQPYDSKPLLYRYIQKNHPGLVGKYKSMFGENYYQPRAYLEELQERAGRLCLKHGIRSSIL